jgi:hypothetical protein
VASARPSAFQTKSRKDVAQAAELVTALDTLRPGDLSRAIEDAMRRGKGWRDALTQGVARLRKMDEGAAAIVEAARG